MTLVCNSPTNNQCCVLLCCVQAAAPEKEPSLPTSVPLNWDTASMGQEDTSQAPPAHEMQFTALLSPFLMSDVPAGTLAAVTTRLKAARTPCFVTTPPSPC